MYACTYMCISVCKVRTEGRRVYIRTHTRMHRCTDTGTHAQMHTCMHPRKHTHTHTHTQCRGRMIWLRLTAEADTKYDNVHWCGEDQEVHNVVLEDPLPRHHQPNCKDHLIQAIKICQITPTQNERDILKYSSMVYSHTVTKSVCGTLKYTNTQHSIHIM